MVSERGEKSPGEGGKEQGGREAAKTKLLQSTLSKLKDVYPVQGGQFTNVSVVTTQEETKGVTSGKDAPQCLANQTLITVCGQTSASDRHQAGGHEGRSGFTLLNTTLAQGAGSSSVEAASLNTYYGQWAWVPVRACCLFDSPLASDSSPGGHDGRTGAKQLLVLLRLVPANCKRFRRTVGWWRTEPVTPGWKVCGNNASMIRFRTSHYLSFTPM
ncbi:hypothetical protein PO909_005046 [Leuciscus waleckii]